MVKKLTQPPPRPNITRLIFKRCARSDARVLFASGLVGVMVVLIDSCTENVIKYV